MNSFASMRRCTQCVDAMQINTIAIDPALNMWDTSMVGYVAYNVARFWKCIWQRKKSGCNAALQKVHHCSRKAKTTQKRGYHSNLPSFFTGATVDINQWGLHAYLYRSDRILLDELLAFALVPRSHRCNASTTRMGLRVITGLQFQTSRQWRKKNWQPFDLKEFRNPN